MQIEKQILDDHQIKLIVTVDDARVSEEMKKAARRIARHVRIPGFRKGKAPYHVIANYYGEETILDEALEPLGQDIYREALDESEIIPYSAGSLDDFTREPFTLTFTIPLAPEVNLGAYRDIRVDYEDPELNDEDVETALEELRDAQATMEPVERAIELEDIAMLNIHATLVREPDEDDPDRNDTWLARDGVRVKITEDSTYPVPGFYEQVVGMAAGDTKEFDMSFGEGDEEIAEAIRGQTLHFDVTVDDVFTYEVPELDDELAKSVGDFDTLDELREDIREHLKEHAIQETNSAYYGQIMEKLLDGVVEIKYPPIMVEEQIDSMIEDFSQELSRQRLNIDDYLKLQNLSMEAMREDFREEATLRLKRALTLGEVVSVEKLHVHDEDIDAQIESMLVMFGNDAEMARSLFANDSMRMSIANQLVADQAVDRLIAIAKGENPEIIEHHDHDEESHEEEDTSEADVKAVADEEYTEETGEGNDTDDAPPAPEAAKTSDSDEVSEPEPEEDDEKTTD